MRPRLPFRSKPAPSPRSDGTAELTHAKEQRDEMDQIAMRHVEVSARIVERIEANHTAEALFAWYDASRKEQATPPAHRHRFPWRHA